MKRTLVAISLALSAHAGAIDDQSVLIERSDPEMTEAIAQARRTLDDFLALSSNPPAGATNFKLKVMFRGEGRVTEHMWVLPFKQTDDGFVGVLADAPDYIKHLKYGQRVTFPRDDVSDWGYELDGKQKGSFTVCVMFKRMPPAEVAQYRRQYGFEC